MCGRFTRSSPPQAIAEEFGVRIETVAPAEPRFNVCPSEQVLVVARGATSAGVGTPAAGVMRWGLVPWFARDPKGGPRAINARAETIATNRTFRDAFARRRCLVVADGFYEWRRDGRGRQPWFIRLRSRRPFGFAGVWERWRAAEGAPLITCAIVTCEANGVVAPIHDRMPVIVPLEARATWIARGASPADLGALLRPYPEDAMEAYPVSKLVNAARTDGPGCIRPLSPSAAGGAMQVRR
ncbi:MAG: SOS response-associated peptidase [Deltaproteobacteria bacterium]|nr:SOS response-associated peptidase [Deltaproteobacteria bacterium]